MSLLRRFKKKMCKCKKDERITVFSPDGEGIEICQNCLSIYEDKDYNKKTKIKTQ